MTWLHYTSRVHTALTVKVIMMPIIQNQYILMYNYNSEDHMHAWKILVDAVASVAT